MRWKCCCALACWMFCCTVARGAWIIGQNSPSPPRRLSSSFQESRPWRIGHSFAAKLVLQQPHRWARPTQQCASSQGGDILLGSDFHNQAQIFIVDSSSISRIKSDNGPPQQNQNTGGNSTNGNLEFMNDINRNDDQNNSTVVERRIQFLPIVESACRTPGEPNGSTSISILPLTTTSTTTTDDHKSAVDQALRATTMTWNWCAHFVVRHSLCPWASASVRGHGAIRIYAWSNPELSLLEQVLEQVAVDFVSDLQNQQADPNAAIAFVVLMPSFSEKDTAGGNNDSWWYENFASFCNLFFELEERWPHYEQVTLAPFHPQWSYFSDNDDDVLAFEKQSPFATISLVSTATIDKAGEAATEQIAVQNQLVLEQKSVAEWRSIYDHAVQVEKLERRHSDGNDCQ